MSDIPAESLAKFIGIRIRDIREGHGLSQVELAKAAKTSQVTLSSIENGSTATNLDILERLLKQLGVTLSELIGANAVRGIPDSAWEKLPTSAQENIEAIVERALGPDWRDRALRGAVNL